MPCKYSTPEEIARQKQYDRRWRESHPGHKKRYLKTYRARQRMDLEWVLRERMQLVRNRAKLHGVPFSLTPEWLAAQPRVCAVSGQPFVLTTQGRGPQTPSFDKIDPDKGYTPENTRIVALWINSAKMEWGDDLIQKLIIQAAEYMTRSVAN